MSVSPPSDGGYGYYSKRIGDLEDEVKRDGKRAQERMDARTQALEEGYKRDLASRDKDLESTVNDIKSNAQDQISREHDYNKTEIDRMRAQTYDKYGRVASNESDALTQQLNDLKAGTDLRHKQDASRLDDAEAEFDRRYEALNKAHEEQLDRVAEESRKAADQNYADVVRDSKSREDELKADNKRTQDRLESRIQSLEEQHQKELARREEESARTIQKVKDNSQETLANERDLNKAEIDRIRNQTYDKWGRYGGDEADVVKQQLSELKDASEIRHKQDRSNLNDAETAYQQRLEEISRDHADELDRVAKSARDSANETYEDSISDEKNQFVQMRDEEQKKYDELNRQKMQEMNSQRREAEKAINTSRLDFEHRLRDEKESNAQRFETAQRSYADSNSEATQRLNDSHNDESRVLRDEIKDLVQDEGRYMKEKGQGTHDAVEEYDNQNRLEKKLIQADYEKQIAKLKQQAKESDAYFAHVNNRNLADKDRYFSGLISKTKLENHLNEKELQKTFEKDRDQLVTRNAHDREQSSKIREQQLHDAGVAKDEALQNQAKAYQDTIAHIREQDDDKIKVLQKDNLTKSTSEDTSVISPAAEAAVRKSMIKEYEKNSQAEHERNRGSEQSIQQNYADRLQGAILQNDARRTTEQHAFALQQHHDQEEFLQHMQDTEFQKNLTLRNNDLEHDKQTDNLNRNYSQMMLKQRNEYENILEAAKNDAAARISAICQEAEFNAKMAQRAFSSRQNELIRGYEKKLADQKLQYDLKFDEVKTQAQTTVREMERKSRQALEEQGRGYEQRIAALESQQKERERYITENYQDELEKVRRSNALLIQKKS